MKHFIFAAITLLGISCTNKSQAQDLVFVAKVPFLDSINLDWENAVILRGDNSNLEVFKLRFANTPKERKRSVTQWQNKFLLFIEFHKSNENEFFFKSFTKLYSDGQKISLSVWGENKTYPNLDKLLELYPNPAQ